MLRRLIVPLVLLAMTIGVFWKQVLTRQYTYLDSPDLTYQVAPWFQLQAAAWHRGELLLWDPYLAGGQSLIGQMQPATAYPFNWLLFLIPLHNGFIRMSALHWDYMLIHFMAALAAYALCRDLGRSRTASVLGAAAFAFGGYVATTAWPQMLHATVWAPLALLFTLRAMREEKPLVNAVLSGLFLGVQWLGGHHQIPTFTVLAISALWIFHIATGINTASRLGRVRLYLALVAMMIAVGAVQLFPAYSYGHDVVRWVSASHEVTWNEPVPYSVHEEFGLPPASVLGVFINGVFKHSNPFVGIVVFFLAICGVLTTWENRAVRLLACMAAASLVFAFAGYTIFHGLIYALAPMVDKARNPAMEVFIFHLAICPLAAFGLDDVMNAPAAWLKRAAIAIAGVASLLWLFVFVTFVSKNEWNVRPPDVALTAFAALLLAALLYAMTTRGIRSPGVLLVVLVMIELGGLAGRDARNRDLGWQFWPILNRDKDVAEFLKRRPGLFRIDMNGDDIPYTFGDWYGMETYFGYVASAPVSFIRVMGDQRTRELLGVQYYLGKSPARPEQREIFAGQAGIKVFETPGAMPRAWTVHKVDAISDPRMVPPTLYNVDPAQATFVLGENPPRLEPCTGDRVAVVRHASQSATIDVDMGCRGMLIVGDAYSKDWTATVDGKSAPLLAAYSIVRGVVVDSGHHRIELRYRPMSVYLGAALTGASLLFGLLLWKRNR